MEWLIGITLALVIVLGAFVALGMYSSRRMGKIEQRRDTFHQLRRMWRLGCGVPSYDEAKGKLKPWLVDLVEAPDHQVEEKIEKLAKDFSIIP